MANDALAQSGIDLGLPQEADYDAVYAAVTSTERGRCFLTELANRNRQADNNALMAAIARVEVAVRSDAPEKQLTHLPDISAAAERLADIAFGLRERGADGTLCDALDAAVREICVACGSDAKAHETKDSVTLIDRSEVTTPERTASEAARLVTDDVMAADAPSSSEPYDMPLQDTEKFAAAAATLAASLNALSEDAQTPSEPQDTSCGTGPIPPHDYQAVLASQPASTAEHRPRWHIDGPDFVFHQPRREANDGSAGLSARPGQPRALLAGPQLLPSPQDDPAELFEPSPKRVAVLPASAPATSAAKPAPTPQAAAVSAAAQAVRVANNPSARSPTGPTVRPMPRPAPVSPLAALRALTEEELIALFG
jgi:hypothetical protein